MIWTFSPVCQTPALSVLGRLVKYSSTFALLFGVFAYLPDLIGLTLWNLFNLFILYFSIRSLLEFSTKKTYLLFLIILFELFTTVQNNQSNTLIIGLTIFGFSMLEKRNYFWASFCLVLSFYTKLYGLSMFCLFLFYPNKLKLTMYTLFWMFILFILPIVIISFDQLLFNYRSWFKLLVHEHPQIDGISLMGILHSWFGLTINKLIPLVIGVIIFCIPLFRFDLYKHYNYRLLILSSLLIWVVIFNHRAESPTYIIASVGVAIWYLQTKQSKLNNFLIVLFFILTTLSATDLFPFSLRENLVKPYVLKALPVVLIWFKILYDLMGVRTKTNVDLV